MPNSHLYRHAHKFNFNEFQMKKIALFITISLLVLQTAAQADERFFTYSHEADVLQEGTAEFEQWLTAKIGKDGGDYSRWEFREELEYGVTDKLTTAFYLNFRDTYFSPDDASQPNKQEFEFKGVSSEWKYQILNPNIDPVGLLLYGEGTYEGDGAEIEEKIVLSKNIGKFVLAFNTVFEQEYEFEHGETIKEGKLALTSGVAYRINPSWSAGLELVNFRKYDSFDFGEEFARAWYVGPNVHYGADKFWVTLTIMPQVAIEGDRDLEEFEKVNARIIAGYYF